MPLLQEQLFKRALTEAGIPHCDDLNIDIENATCYNNNKKYNVIYPKSYINKINNMNNDKIYDYNFIGNNFKRREWVTHFD